VDPLTPQNFIFMHPRQSNENAKPSTQNQAQIQSVPRGRKDCSEYMPAPDASQCAIQKAVGRSAPVDVSLQEGALVEAGTFGENAVFIMTRTSTMGY
jgi:hypothetical protein